MTTDGAKEQRSGLNLVLPTHGLYPKLWRKQRCDKSRQFVASPTHGLRADVALVILLARNSASPATRACSVPTAPTVTVATLTAR